MKTLFKAIITLSVFVVSAGWSKAAVVIATPTSSSFTFYALDPATNAGRTGFYVAEFNIQVSLLQGSIYGITSDEVTFGLTTALYPVVKGSSFDIYQNGVSYPGTDFVWIAYNPVTGSSISPNGAYFTLLAAQTVMLPISVEFAVSDSGNDIYGLRMKDFTWINGNFLFTAPNLTWDAGNVSGTAIPEPSTYAAIAGLSVLGLAFLKRRKSLQKT